MSRRDNKLEDLDIENVENEEDKSNKIKRQGPTFDEW